MSTSMLTTMDLAEGVTAACFAEALDECATALQRAGLLQECSALSQRYTNTLLDTDERQQGYMFVMRFQDRAQADRAIRALANPDGAVGALHLALQRMSCNQIFSYWEECEDG
ncbi:MAG: DUF6614 family protein [Pseudomonadota bacterium]